MYDRILMRMQEAISNRQYIIQNMRQKNVPVISCPHCRDSYLTADTLHEIERIKLHRKSFAKKRPIPVAAFRNISTKHQDGLSG